MTAPRQVLLDAAAIARAIEQMAADLAAVLAAERCVLVGIRAGGDVLAGRLAAHLPAHGVAVDGVGALDITLYRDDFGHRSHWPSLRDSEIDFALDDRTVVLVDDVLFTGRTVRAALEALLDYGRPARVLLAVLLDRGLRQLPIQPDVVGVSAPQARDVLCLAEFVEQGATADAVLLEGGRDA